MWVSVRIVWVSVRIVWVSVRIVWGSVSIVRVSVRIVWGSLMPKSAPGRQDTKNDELLKELSTEIVVSERAAQNKKIGSLSYRQYSLILNYMGRQKPWVPATPGDWKSPQVNCHCGNAEVHFW